MSEGAISVLLVEDDGDLRAMVAEYLGLSGFRVFPAGSLAEARALLASQDCELAVIDRGLPDGDGLDLARTLRQRGDTGIVVLSARSELQSRLEGYDEGVDHYMVKPVVLRELAAVLRAVHQRAAGAPPQRWQLDTLQWRLTAPNGREIRLTRAECALLAELTRAPGQMVSREVLRRALGYPVDYDPRRMEILVRRLRNKITAESGLEHPIETVHARGFAFTAPVSVVGQDIGHDSGASLVAMPRFGADSDSQSD